MLATMKSKSRTEDNELLFLRKYKCLNCGELSEFLQTIEADKKTTLSCDQCGSTNLEAFAYHVDKDYFW